MILEKLRNQYRINPEAQNIINDLEIVYQKWHGKLPISFCIAYYDRDLTLEILKKMGYEDATARRIPTGRDIFSLMIHTSKK